MRVLIAPDSYKECLNAEQVSSAMAQGVRQADPGAEIIQCPVADGGEGTLDALVAARQGRVEKITVMGPLGNDVEVGIGWFNDHDGRVAVIEMAQAAGLSLVPREIRDPTKTTSYGVGQMIAYAVNQGVDKLLVGVGGSATCDGGCGMASALGIDFKGVDHDAIRGGDLIYIQGVDSTGLLPGLKHVKVVFASDVSNPLCGENGAAQVYAPQKGAGASDVALLERGLTQLAQVIGRDLSLDAAAMHGTGAGGGMGYGLVSFLQAEMHLGVGLILEASGFSALVKDADLVITGEGQFDHQSLNGKACIGVAQASLRSRVPSIVIAGGLGAGYEASYKSGVGAVTAITPGPMSLRDAMLQAPALISDATERMMRAFLLGRYATGSYGASACSG